MKVKELKEKLKSFDENLEVCSLNSPSGDYYTVYEVRKIKTYKGEDCYSPGNLEGNVLIVGLEN